jgi:hypothetical protein
VAAALRVERYGGKGRDRTPVWRGRRHHWPTWRFQNS